MKVVIVGGVAGGAGTAARLRRRCENCEIVMLERGEFISFANCGLPYYIGGEITEKSDLLLQTPEGFSKRFNVDVRIFNEVISVDTKNKNVTVKNLKTGESYNENYDKLVLSPGASPIKTNLPGFDNPNVFTLRNIPDTVKIKDFIDKNHPKTCTIIGAGFIGLEMAENISNNSVTVNVIEAAPHVMAPIDLDMAHEVHNYIRSKGVNLFLSSKCTELHESYVLLENGSKIDSDMIIMSIGVTPETKFIKGSSIELGSRVEILVNEHLETSVKDVYAIGDAVSVKHIVSDKTVLIPLASPANKQARIVADNLAGDNKIYKGSQGTSIMKFFDMTVAVTGLKEEQLASEGIPYNKAITYSASHAGYYPGGDMMSLKLLFSPDGSKIFGAQIVGGKGVDKRIDSVAIAIRFGLDIYSLQEMELSYAPPYSSAKDPVNMIGYVAGNIVEGRMPQIFVEDLEKISPNDLFIDVRTSGEYNRGNILGSINIPLDEIRARINEIDLNKNIYLTCQIGLRGYIAQSILMQHGAKVWNLAGGYRLYSIAKADTFV